MEADISILVQGRNREINEFKNIITCLENKLKSSDVTNESLRQSLKQINSEKFNGVLSAEQSLSNKPEQINTYNCTIDTIKLIETAKEFVYQVNLLFRKQSASKAPLIIHV